MSTNAEQPTPQRNSRWQRAWPRVVSVSKKVWRRLENILFALVLLLVVLYFVLQLPVVQNWLTQKAAAYLSKELQTTVSIQHLEVEFFDKVVLERFFVADLKGDTLLYAHKFEAGLSSNIFSLLNGKLVFGDIALEHARLNIRRAPGEYDNNLQFLLDYFANPDTKPNPNPKPIRLKVLKLQLTDVEFVQDDGVRGSRLFFRLPTGAIRINRLDLPGSVIDIQSVNLDGLEFALRETPARPLPQPVRPAASLISNEQIDTARARLDRLRIQVDEFRLVNGRFRLDKIGEDGRDSPERPDVMDYEHLRVDRITMEADSVFIDDNLVSGGKLRHLAARERCGFELSHVQAEHVFVSDTITALYNAAVQTPYSHFGDTIALHYREYQDYIRFNDRVSLDLRLKPGSGLRLGDIRYFSPEVADNVFFKNNQNEVAAVSGAVNGRVNRLRGKDLRLGIGQGTRARLDFRGDNLAEGADQLNLAFDFYELVTNMQTIRTIVPGFSAPAYFNKLGNVGFAGSYEIIFGYNHIARGAVHTSVGSGDLDMELDLTKGTENAKYSGFLNMRGFDLAGWTGNRQFGNTTFHLRIAEGSKGLSLATMNATLSGTVDTLRFRGYTYRNVEMNGSFEEYKFVGKLGIDDPNIAFEFDGRFDFKDTLPVYMFTADLKRLDMEALNLVDEDWFLTGRVEQVRLTGRTLEELAGSATFRNLQLVQDQQYVHRVDSLRFSSAISPGGRRRLEVLSDVVDASLDGRFDFDLMKTRMLHIFSDHHPGIAERLNLTAPSPVSLTDQYTVDVHIKNSEGLTRLLDERLDTLRQVRFHALVDMPGDSNHVSLNLPEVRYDGLYAQGIQFDWKENTRRANYYLLMPYTILPGNRRVTPLLLQGAASGDLVQFNLEGQDSTNLLQRIHLNGTLGIVDSLWEVRFNTSDIQLFQEYWVMDENNFIRFGPNYLEAKNFDLMNGNKRILIDTLNSGRGLALSITNLDLSDFGKVLGNDGFKFKGKIYDFDVRIGDVFELRNMEAFLNTDTVFLNNTAYGILNGNVGMESTEKPLTWKVLLVDNYQQRLRVAGAWYFQGDDPVPFEDDIAVRPGELQVHARANGFPLQVIETFVPGISGTLGRFNADAWLGGSPSRLSLDGRVNVVEGKIQVDYLKSPVYLYDQPIVLTNYKIWADGDTIWDNDREKDVSRNAAVVRGGLRHNFFRDWQIECSVESLNNRFHVLNTRKSDSDVYYGQANGKFLAKFSGTFERTNIQIDATSGPGTQLFIPLSTASDLQDVNFITFVNKNHPDTLKEKNKTRSFDIGELKGLNFQMNLSVTEDAEVQLIFDEQAGDIIRGRGEGDITLIINREGEFLMYGSYNILQGEYLFTLLNWVNKPFTVERGGIINWTGDPFGARINLDATYDENTPLYNLISDEVVLAQDATLEQAARQSTRVLVTMHLTGDLFKPNIGFDLAFPNVTGRVKTLTDNKTRQLHQDQSELTRQVFGLVVVGSFLPQGTSSLIQGGDYVTSAFNTLTQVLSSQFSNYLTALAAEWFGGTVSSIDLDIAYNEYRNVFDKPGQPTALTQIGRELQVRLTSGFNNDRWVVQLGSQFGLGRPGTSVQDGFLGEDVAVEIQLTENRQWRLRIYQRTEPDIAGAQRRLRFGGGLSFRKEYDSFSDMMQGLGGWFLRKK